MHPSASTDVQLSVYIKKMFFYLIRFFELDALLCPSSIMLLVSLITYVIDHVIYRCNLLFFSIRVIMYGASVLLATGLFSVY